MKADGLGDRVTVLRRDYREFTGTYDKLVSIEMIEAIGWQNFPNFFSTCSRLLNPVHLEDISEHAEPLVGLETPPLMAAAAA